MKITGSAKGAAIRHVNQIASKQYKKASERAIRRGDVSPSGSVVVHLSESLRDLGWARGVVESEPDVRQEQVKAIKDRIEEKTYKVDHEKTAEKMANAFIGEMSFYQAEERLSPRE